MSRFIKPETVLKRSEDLLALNTPQSLQQGLESLTEVFQSKRFKSTPLPVLEPIVLRFLQLCTQLRKPRLARDALTIYRAAAQGVSIPSIELVIRKFLEGAEERLGLAMEESRTLVEEVEGREREREQAAAATAGGAEAGAQIKETVDEEEDDLELPLQPLTLLMDSLVEDGSSPSSSASSPSSTTTDAPANSVTTNDGLVIPTGTPNDEERIERAVVTPWMRFCWEAYKSCLEVCKSNSRLEVLYQTITLQAFKFCRTHSRKSEFRRLCEQLRKDLSNAQKYSHQTHAVNFSDADTLTRHLDSRFAQLETSVELELWQEAFRSIEDVHGLLVNPAAKKATKPAMMANYYEKLTRIFKAEGSTSQMAVFHASAWSRYTQYAEREKERKEAAGQSSAGVLNEKAPGCVLLSALAVPVGTGEGVTDSGRNTQRLVGLLNLAKMPTRQSLMKDLTSKNILQRVPTELRQLYTAIEKDFQPLRASKAIAPLIATLSEDADYAPYVRGLKEVVLSRLFQSLAKIYSTITIQHVLNLLKPFEAGPWQIDDQSLEKFLMTASKRGDLSLTVDHVTKAITFQEDTFSKPVPLMDITNLSPEASTSSDSHSQLARLAIALQNTIQYLNPALAEEARAARAAATKEALTLVEDERKAVHHRVLLVHARRAKLSEINTRREREESHAKAEKARVAAEEASRREAELFKERERERIMKEVAAIRAEEAKKLADTLKARGGLKVDIDEMETLDTDKLLQLQSKQIEKEQKEIAERMRIIGKRVDHIERAMRKEEIPLVLADYERQKAEDKAAYTQAIKLAQEAAEAKHKSDLAAKERLSRMLSDYTAIREAVESTRAEEFERKRAAAAVKIAEEKEKLKKRVLAERAAEKKRQEDEKRTAEKEARLAKERAAREESEAAERQVREKEAAEKAAAEAAAKEAEVAAKREARIKEKEKDMEAIRAQERRAEEAAARRAGGVSSAPSRPAPLSSAPSAGERPRLALAPRSQATPAAAVGVAASLLPSSIGAVAHQAVSGAAAVVQAAAAAVTPASSTPPSAPAGQSWRDRMAAKGPESASSPPAPASAPPRASYRPPGASGTPSSGERPSYASRPSQAAASPASERPPVLAGAGRVPGGGWRERAAAGGEKMPESRSGGGETWKRKQ